jgi:hypothetical protein
MSTNYPKAPVFGLKQRLTLQERLAIHARAKALIDPQRLAAQTRQRELEQIELGFRAERRARIERIHAKAKTTR